MPNRGMSSTLLWLTSDQEAQWSPMPLTNLRIVPDDRTTLCEIVAPVGWLWFEMLP